MDLAFIAPSRMQASVDVCDVGGRLVRRIADARFSGGANTVRWDLLTAGGMRVRAGAYLLRLSGEVVDETRVIVLAR